MGIRRRRRKLTTLMSRLDQRLKSVELRPISLLSSDEVAAAVESGQPTGGPETIVSASAPWQFKKVHDGYVYSKSVTGLKEDRVELYFESDPGAEVGSRLEVSGIHWASNSVLDVSGDNFTLSSIDTPPWTERPAYRHNPENDQLSGVTITHAYYFKPESDAPATWTTRRRLQTRRLVDTFSITDTTVTLVMNAVHKFEVGDVIFVDIFEADSRAYGIDGLFRVTAVTSNTIEYELLAGVDTPTGTITPDSDVYVFPVAREWAQVGSIWVDSANNKTYYWDGIRWNDYTPSTDVGKDGDPPAAPTGFTVTSEAAVFGATSEPYAKVALSWTPPTLTSQGEELTDLAGYKIKWRRSPSEDFRSKILFEPEISSYTFDDDVRLAQNETYYFELYAFDSGQQDSAAATATHTTPKRTGNLSLYGPTNPVAVSRLGTIKVEWDGKLKTGATTAIAAPSDVVSLNIYVSLTPNFDIADADYVKRTRVFGSDGGFDVFTDLSYSTDYHIKITVSNSSGVESLPSAEVIAQVLPLVNTDLIANTLTTWPFAGQVVSANALLDGSVSASKILGGAVQAQALAANAVTSLAIAANAVTSAAIAANAVTGPAIASSAITAGKIAAGAVTAVSIAAGAITSEKITAGAIGAQQIAADAITADKISAGAIGADEIAAGAIVAGKLAAGAVTAGTIAALAIEAGQIAANAITAQKIEAGAITAVKIAAEAVEASKIAAGAITADKIAADMVLASLIRLQDTDPSLGRIELRGTGANRGIVAFKNSGGGAANATFRLYTANGEAYLKDTFIDGDVTVSGGRIVAGSTIVSSGLVSGGIIRTSGSGKRVEMRDDTNSLRFYNSSGQVAGEIEGLTLGARFDSVLGAYLQVGGGVTAGSGTTPAISVTSSGLTLLVAPTTTFAANMRRPDAGNVIQVVSSDLRIKENVLTITDGINVISQLNPVTFNSKVDDTDKVISGFLAQDVANIFPVDSHTVVTEIEGTVPPVENAESLNFENNPLLSLNHIELIPYLTKAIQELVEKNSELENRIATLEGN